MGEPAGCLDCGLPDPPPEMTCDGGTPGRTPRDHFIGTDRGCQYCGRLVAACGMRPCQEVRAVWHEIERGSGEGGGDG
jgi:hypothetical protein